MYGGVQVGKTKPMSRIMFEKFDKDQSDSIDVSEFSALCEDLGHVLQPQELDFAIKMLDKDGNGTINFTEFQHWWSQQNRFENIHLTEDKLKKLKEYLEIFKKFDKDSNGILDKGECTLMYQEFKKKNMTKHSLDEFVGCLDQNGDGVLSFNELAEWLMQKEIQ